MLNEPQSIEMADQKSTQPNGNHENAHFPESTETFIEKNFNVRIGAENKINENKSKFYGVINFQGYEHSPCDLNTSFIRFDYMGDENTNCDSMYKLLIENEPWMFKIPKIIISINGGLNDMNFKSKKYKDNLTRGLVEVIKRDQTWIIGRGFDNGVEKLVAEDIFKWKHEQEDMQDSIRLIGITNWETIHNNHKLLLPEMTYEYCLSDENGKYLLNDFNDHFIFCDKGTEKENGTEIDFRVKFEQYLKLKEDTCLVQIVFDGDKHALKIAHKTLQTQSPLLVIKGSGGAANIIAEIAELPKKSEGSLNDIVDENIEILKLSESERSEYRNYLFEIHDNFLDQIFICNVLDTSERFEKKILQAMILGNENSLEKTLNLCIRLNCPEIADKYVFSDSKYKNIDQSTLQTLFMSSMVNNKPEFVKLFLENKFNVHNFINGQILKELYLTSFDPTKSKCGELLSKFSKQTNLKEIRSSMSEYEILFIVGIIIKSLSGHIIENPYKEFDTRSGSDHNYGNYKLGMHDLFQWSLISGLTDMSEIFWKTGQDNIGSALIASWILKNMASQIFVDGDNNLQKSLTDASEKYHGLAVSTLTDAYGKCKSKTYSIITQPLERWNKLTCVQIASYGNMVEFLNHDACKFHSTMAWMGGLPLHLCSWKILLTIPFSLILIRVLIMPSFPTKKSFSEDVNESNCQNYHLIEKKEYDSNKKLRKKVSFCEVMGIFYRAPVVKFFIYVFSYVVFLLIFTYMNLVEFKPLEEVRYIREMAAELFVYFYILTFSIEEIRQIRKIKKIGFSNKLKEYLSLGWNKLDAVILTILIASVITRISIYRADFVICRCLYAIVLSLFYLRSMYFYFANQKIGPQIIMMRDMLRVILFFLSMYVIFLMSYGTLVQSLNYPNKQLNFKLLTDVLYLPYLQSNGELNLEQLDDSTTNSRSKSVFKTMTIFSSFAVFLLITNVLLMNLLIAMFFYTYYEIQEQAGKRWCFLKFHLIQTFTIKRLLPPPLNILYSLVRIVSIPFRRCCKNEINLQPLNNEQNLKLRTFEQKSAQIAKFELEEKEIDNKYKPESNNVTEILGKINDQLENGALIQQYFHRRLNTIGKQIVDISSKIKNLKNTPQ